MVLECQKLVTLGLQALPSNPTAPLPQYERKIHHPTLRLPTWQDNPSGLRTLLSKKAIKLLRSLCAKYAKSRQASWAHDHLELTYNIHETLGGEGKR